MIPFRCIVVAADFSEHSRQAFRWACSLGGPASRLLVLHVVEATHVAELSDVAPGSESVHHAAIRERLQEQYAPGQPVDCEYFVRDGNPPDEILSLAHEHGSDLIVLGTHGRRGLDRLLAGSVAETVLRRAACPVLAVRLPLSFAEALWARDERAGSVSPA